MPKTRQLTKPLLTRPDRLDADEQEQLAGIRAQYPHLDALAGHLTAFAEMMAGLTGSSALDGWLAAAEADDQPELHSFATGITSPAGLTANRNPRVPLASTDYGRWRRCGKGPARESLEA